MKRHLGDINRLRNIIKIEITRKLLDLRQREYDFSTY